MSSTSKEGESHLALYRKYRPTKLSEVVGQPQVTDILEQALAKKCFAHAYLFTGQRGTGKTTVARILAHRINELDYSDNINGTDIDIIEIDAASNNSVDDIRTLRDNINLAPMHSPYKVYIIDEFHMLSKPAFNALLKTIEEPPEHAVFILATTELQKVPATILSRVQRFHFRPLPPELLVSHLRKIADKEKIDITDDALVMVAKRGGGSVRDSITLLDQLSNAGHEITPDTVEEVLGLVSDKAILDIINSIGSGDAIGIINQIRSLLDDGASATGLAEQLINALCELAADNSSYYYLIDALLDVAKSSMPATKLLATLIKFSLDENSTASSAVLTNASHQQMANRIPLNAAKQTVQTSPNQAVVAAGSAKDSKLVTTAATSSTVTKASVAPAKAEVPATTGVTAIKKSDKARTIDNFSWDDLITKVGEMDEPAVHALLQLADYRYSTDNGTLSLFFAKAFHRKKAEAESFKNVLLGACRDLYEIEPIIAISKSATPNDSAAAKVLDIMGGGEIIRGSQI